MHISKYFFGYQKAKQQITSLWGKLHLDIMQLQQYFTLASSQLWLSCNQGERITTLETRFLPSTPIIHSYSSFLCNFKTVRPKVRPCGSLQPTLTACDMPDLQSCPNTDPLNQNASKQKIMEEQKYRLCSSLQYCQCNIGYFCKKNI